MSKKKWRIEIVLDFRNNKIKKRSTLDSIIERMSIGHPMNDALVGAEMPVNLEPVSLRTEGHAILGRVSGRLMWERELSVTCLRDTQQRIRQHTRWHH